MKIILLICICLVAGCSGFQFAPDYPIIDSDQLTCSPADSRLCSGWKID